MSASLNQAVGKRLNYLHQVPMRTIHQHLPLSTVGFAFCELLTRSLVSTLGEVKSMSARLDTQEYLIGPGFEEAKGV